VQAELGDTMSKLYDPTTVMTLFAPSNASLAAYKPGSGAISGHGGASATSGHADPAAHIVLGRALNATAVAQAAAAARGSGVRTLQATTLAGGTVALTALGRALASVAAGGVTARVLRTDERGCEAVVHVIDAVLP
jgi:uncharacterized surface protein with fasciclin (FAS1) repeats